MTSKAPTPDDWISIDIDRRHIARRRRGHWQLCRKDDVGVYRPIEEWDGPRRSLFVRLEAHNIVPSREAETAIRTLPEQPAFRRDAEKRGQKPLRAV